jgi:hypothetical protein
LCDTAGVPDIAALITVLMIDRPMCVECLATRTELTVLTVKSYLDRMGTTMNVQRGTQRCRTCGHEGSVFWLVAHPDDASK